MANNALIQEGDWVSGTTPTDEKFIGFVLEADQNGGMNVWVTQSDRDEIVSTTVRAKLAKARKLPDYVPSAPEELRDLIELALATQDKAWFDELSAALAESSAAP